MNEFVQEFATYTKYYQDQFVNIYEQVLKPEARVSLNSKSCRSINIPRICPKTIYS